MQLELQDRSFEAGGSIPTKYSCEGEDISPPLAWSEVPEEMESLALICDDPDAPGGTFSHWVLYNLPPLVTSLPENVPAEEQLSDGGTQGRNDFGNLGYGGPCPPSGETHTYYFRLFALDTELDLPPGAARKQVYEAMEGHILDSTELQGQYTTS